MSPAPDDRRAREPLQSILTLAVAATTTPLFDSTAEATIYTQSIGKTVGWDSDTPSYDLLLPGNSGHLLFVFGSALWGAGSSSHRIDVGLIADSGGIAHQSNNRSVYAPAKPGEHVAFRTAANSAVNWGATAQAGSSLDAWIVRTEFLRYTANFNEHYNMGLVLGPGAFTDKYLLFRFHNDAVGMMNYGWVEMLWAKVSPGYYPGMGVSLGDWAYDDSGAFIGAGQTSSSASEVDPIHDPRVPEIDPSGATSALALAAGALVLIDRQRRYRPAADAMGGALVAGARGLRRFRQERTAPTTA